MILIYKFDFYLTLPVNRWLIILLYCLYKLKKKKKKKKKKTI